MCSPDNTAVFGKHTSRSKGAGLLIYIVRERAGCNFALCVLEVVYRLPWLDMRSSIKQFYFLYFLSFKEMKTKWCVCVWGGGDRDTFVCG